MCLQDRLLLKTGSNTAFLRDKLYVQHSKLSDWWLHIVDELHNLSKRILLESCWIGFQLFAMLCQLSLVYDFRMLQLCNWLRDHFNCFLWDVSKSAETLHHLQCLLRLHPMWKQSDNFATFEPAMQNLFITRAQLRFLSAETGFDGFALQSVCSPFGARFIKTRLHFLFWCNLGLCRMHIRLCSFYAKMYNLLTKIHRRPRL
jgi:hypothetical protein